MRSVVVLAIAGLIMVAGCSNHPGYQQLENGSFTAELNGFSIHYEIHGEGPALMTLPNSWGLSLAGLRALYRPLEGYFTLVYFDPRGMGESGPVIEPEDMGATSVRADFDALRRHLALDRVDAIGWSNGAMNLLLLALERPETLSSAVFLHGMASFLPEDGESIRERYPELSAQFLVFSEQVLAADLPDDVKDERSKQFNTQVWFTYMFADREAAPERLAELFADAEFSWRHGLYSQQEWPTFDVRDRLAQIDVRCLVVAGKQDMLPPAKALEIQRGIPDSELVVFAESGHFAPYEETEKFVATVRSFYGR